LHDVKLTYEITWVIGSSVTVDLLL